MAGKYIKTDRNGTKYYADSRCRKCGGQGGLDEWAYTGWTCFRCGGSGIDPHPDIYKIYTPEYEAKLNARRAKREAEKVAKRVADFNEHFSEKLASLGFDENGKIYVVKGNTYEIKDKLKEAGASYRAGLKWYFSNPTDEYETSEIDYKDCLDINPEYGTINWKGVTELEELVAVQPVEESKSEYIGEVGQRIEVEAILDHEGSFTRPSFRGWGEESVYVYTFLDKDGNALVWKTTAGFNHDGKCKVQLKGTIKEHSEYKGIKQTMLQRCKVVIRDGE